MATDKREESFFNHDLDPILRSCRRCGRTSESIAVDYPWFDGRDPGTVYWVVVPKRRDGGVPDLGKKYEESLGFLDKHGQLLVETRVSEGGFFSIREEAQAFMDSLDAYTKPLVEVREVVAIFICGVGGENGDRKG